MKKINCIYLLIAVSCQNRQDEKQFVSAKSKFIEQNNYIHKIIEPHINENIILSSINVEIDYLKNKQKEIDCSVTIINDIFANSIIDFTKIKETSMDPIFKKQYKIKLVVTPSESDIYYKDSTYLINCGKSIFEFSNINKLDSAHVLRPVISKADIVDNSIHMYKGIYIGMKKTDFMKILNRKYTNCNTIRVDTRERNYDNIFLFHRERLYKIKLLNTSI